MVRNSSNHNEKIYKMDRNYFIGTPEGGNSGGSKFDIMAFLPSLMGGGGKSLDPNLVAALMNNKGNQDAWGGAGCWWIWIILLFFVWGGWGGNGFGNNNGANGLPTQLNNDAGRELLMNAIQGNGTAIGQLASSLNCSTQQLQSAICNIQGQIQQVGNQVGLSSQQIINAVQSGNNQLLSQIAECCCAVNNNITKMGYENQLSTCNQTNTLVNTMNGNTLQLRDATQSGFQAVLSKLDAAEVRVLQDKLDAERTKSSALAGQLSQEHQTAQFGQMIGQATAPLGAALGDLSARLAKIECKQPETVTIPYIPAMGNFIPVNYGVNINPYSTLNGCGC